TLGAELSKVLVFSGDFVVYGHAQLPLPLARLGAYASMTHACLAGARHTAIPAIVCHPRPAMTVPGQSLTKCSTFRMSGSRPEADMHALLGLHPATRCLLGERLPASEQEPVPGDNPFVMGTGIALIVNAMPGGQPLECLVIQLVID